MQQNIELLKSEMSKRKKIMLTFTSNQISTKLNAQTAINSSVDKLEDYPRDAFKNTYKLWSRNTNPIKSTFAEHSLSTDHTYVLHSPPGARVATFLNRKFRE